jgi:D-amino-acid dehydrogenase
LAGWRRTLERLGVELREQCDVLGFDADAAGRTIQQVRTTQGPLAAETFVLAAGAWSLDWARRLDCRIPIQPGKGYSVTMPRPALCPQRPIIFEEHRVAVTPWTSGYRLGSTMEFAGFDSRINRRRLALLTDGAAQYLHEPVGQPVLEEWAGFRPMSCDELPLIGPTPRWPNVFLGTGHGMLGLSWSPATGRLIAELVTGETPHLDPAPYRVERFG